MAEAGGFEEHNLIVLLVLRLRCVLSRVRDAASHWELGLGGLESGAWAWRVPCPMFSARACPTVPPSCRYGAL